MDGLEVPFGGLLKRGDWQLGERVLKAQHLAFAGILLVACEKYISCEMTCSANMASTYQLAAKTVSVLEPL